MFHQNFPFIFLYLFILSVCCNGQEVEIPQGLLRGDIRTNRDGGTYYAFKKIPFAKPPVGNLRFKPPEAADGWIGVKNATEEMPACPQLFSNQGVEDCLYLNVYTPGLPAENVTQRPVMVYIFGGAYIAGSASESRNGAQFLLTKDVVVVNINYRVGIFGFLSLDDPNLGVTGNAGLKDQVLALQWVNSNIEYFGGDPNNVLIFGVSAGSVSVHFHMLSPMSRGLFHKAISESGVTISPIVLDNTRNNALMIADELGIQTQNWEEMLSSLQELSTEDLAEAQLALVEDYPQYSFITRPILEISSSQPTFLEQRPIDIIQSGDYNHAPYIHGINDAEGLMLFTNSNDDTGETPIIPYFTGYIPLDLQIEPGSIEEEDIIQRYRSFYYDGDESNRENITGDVRFYTDYAFTYPQYRATMEHLKTALYPIYFYYFTADTELNFIKLESTVTSSYPGAAHSDEVFYLWYTDQTPTIENGSVEDVTSRNLVDLWTNFAMYGNPTPEGFGYIWEPVQENEFNYLHIDTEGSSPQVNLLPESIQFWSDIYADYYDAN